MIAGGHLYGSNGIRNHCHKTMLNKLQNAITKPNRARKEKLIYNPPLTNL